MRSAWFGGEGEGRTIAGVWAPKTAAIPVFGARCGTDLAKDGPAHAQPAKRHRVTPLRAEPGSAVADASVLDRCRYATPGWDGCSARSGPGARLSALCPAEWVLCTYG